MSHLFTLQEFRDNIRRAIGIVPPIDVPNSGAAPGDQPTNWPVPSNAQINQALQQAVSDINRECQFHVLQFTVPVPAQIPGEFGPFRIDLSNLNPNTVGTIVSPVGLINDVLRVLWYPEGGAPPVILQPQTRNALDRQSINNYYAELPSMPQQWWVEQYSLWISPAQGSAGIYQLTCGTGVTGLQCENDTLDQVPIDFQVCFSDRAIVRLAMSQAMDVEAMDVLQMFGSSYTDDVRQFKRWREGGSGTPQATLTFVSYRTGYGTRRTVR